MSNVRDELQRWVDGVDATHEDGLADLTHDVIPVDLARRVLAEMDEAEADFQLVADQLDNLRDDLAAAQLKLDAVREWAQNGEAYIRGGQRKELFRILDGEGDA